MARVLLFGALADAAGWREREMEAHDVTSLRNVLSEDPALKAALARPGVQVALDRSLIRSNARLTAASEVAFLPAMSGG